MSRPASDSMAPADSHPSRAGSGAGRARRPRAVESGSRVLLVAADAANALMVEGQFAAHGCRCVTAKDGLEALELWRAARFAAVITECCVPKMNGLELIRSIRRGESAKGVARTPIIVCDEGGAGKEACIEAGATDCICGPMSSPELREKLERWLSVPQQDAKGDPVPQEPPIDAAVLAQFSGGNSDLEDRLLREFRKAAGEDAAELRAAAGIGDPVLVAQAAHRLRGASETIGAHALAEACAALERASRDNDRERMRSCLEPVYRELGRVETHESGRGGAGVPGLRVLVVEDHDFQRSALAALLTRLGAREVHEAPNGRAALGILRLAGGDIDLVISDLDMPDMDGMEFLRHMGATHATVPVILTSALERALLSSVEAMADAYGIRLLGTVEKPVSQAAIETLLPRAAPEGRAGVVDAAPSRTPISRAEIEQALRAGEFEAYFQPKVEMRTGRVVGAEALARWRRGREVCSPGVFLQPLEEAGLLSELTWQVLDHAAASCRRWRDEGFEFPVCVNVSLTTVSDVSASDLILAVARDHGLEAPSLVIEVTESALASNLGAALETLSRLRLRGFGLSIDDFGTGYSSLQQLTQIPFTELKIDRSFVHKASTRESARVILESSLDLARRLGLSAVAEGVEDEADWNLLAGLGCDFAQGYFVARPMDSESFLEWLRSRPAGT